jgi:hypothetical protein
VRVAVTESLHENPALGPDLVPRGLGHTLVIQVDLLGEERRYELGRRGAASGGLEEEDEILVQHVLVGVAKARYVVDDISGVVLDYEARASAPTAMR